jgi:hypothetical protein
MSFSASSGGVVLQMNEDIQYPRYYMMNENTEYHSLLNLLGNTVLSPNVEWVEILGIKT